MAAKKKIDPSLDRAMKASLRAYSTGNKKFFDYLSDNVRIFNLNSTEPMVGRKKFESAFAASFKIKRKVATVFTDVQVSGEQAVLAQTLRITSNGVTSHIRQTVIWEHDAKGAWKMSHIHSALVGQPVAAGKVPLNALGVRVLNERIATVAATVGVAQ